MEAREDWRRAEHLLVSAGTLTPPVDMMAVATYCHLQVCFCADLPDKVAGFLYRGPLRDVIVVNARHARVRQRFTIAHEIAHWYLSDQGVSFKGIHRDCGSPSERAADAFAAELLMPERLLRQEWRRHREISLLAQRFQVSRGAMIRRLRETGILS